MFYRIGTVKALDSQQTSNICAFSIADDCCAQHTYEQPKTNNL
jgi:hypothetical protein